MNPRMIVLAALALFGIAAGTAAAQQSDTVWVQTLTFDSITTRRGVWKFPDASQSFRKILMYHTLKCDPRTTQDKYACGEWDYATYAFVNRHTGRLDSTAQEYPWFRVGVASPDSFGLVRTPTFSTYKRLVPSSRIATIANETTHLLPEGNASVEANTRPSRMQFVVTRAQLQSAGLSGASSIGGIRLNARTAGLSVGNLTVRLKSAPSVSPVGFDNGADFVTVYSANTTFAAAGWQTLQFTAPYQWTGVSNILVEISHDGASGEFAQAFAGRDTAAGWQANAANAYLEFDGVNDYVDFGTIPELSGTQAATFEAWVRIDEWEAWNKVFGVGGGLQIETGPTSGQLYCYNRNGGNWFGVASNAIKLKTWTHLAFVYDGTQPDNARRMRLYVNGAPAGLAFTGVIAATAPVTNESFTLSEISHGAAALKGAFDEVRVFGAALDSATIRAWWAGSGPMNTHPYLASLLAHYSMEGDTGGTLHNRVGGLHNGTLVGAPQWRTSHGSELLAGQRALATTPNIGLLKGSYTVARDTSVATNRVANEPVTVQTYEIRDRRPVLANVEYVWPSGYSYTYNEAGAAVDSVAVPPTEVLRNRKLRYYGAPFEVYDQIEIGRYITPYGINLDLGPNGFTWIYDVTDYAPLLRDSVDFTSGSNSELADVRFAFIKGDPPRRVLAIDTIWGWTYDRSYRDIAADRVFSARTLKLGPDTRQAMVRTRLTGHGHNSNDGSYPHCCEWKDNTHYLLLNGQQAYTWHVFQYDDCALNPVYPQGGTWPGSREGWCPGDRVKDHDFEITDWVRGDSVTVDYDITDVPTDNLGMGNGVYLSTFQLFQYGEPTHPVDAEVYDVLAPTDVGYYSRKNPMCGSPRVIVRNNGAAPITALEFNYGVSGGTQEHYSWSGSIKPNVFDTVQLPVSGNPFWLGDAQHRFTVRVSSPNGQADQYAANDSMVTTYRAPDLYGDQLVLWYRTNKRPEDFTLEIRDASGNLVFQKTNAAAETLYRDTLSLAPGCYSMELVDRNLLGLSYWAYAEQGSGYLRLYNTSGKQLKAFNPDCGAGTFYSFSVGNVGRVDDPAVDNVLALFPNPAAERVTVVLDEFPIGAARLELYNVRGELVKRQDVTIGDRFSLSVDTRDLAAGSYLVRVVGAGRSLQKRFVKK